VFGPAAKGGEIEFLIVPRGTAATLEGWLPQRIWRHRAAAWRGEKAMLNDIMPLMATAITVLTLSLDAARRQALQSIAARNPCRWRR
jgi:hypothetical protein